MVWFISWWYFLQLVFSSIDMFIIWYLDFIGIFFSNGIFTHVLIWIFDIIWTLCFLVTLVCALLVYLVFCLNYILFGSWKSCACIFVICISYGMLTFVDPIYRINSIKSFMAKMCMKFNFTLICTYLCGVCHMYCSCSNYFGPNEFGYHVVFKFVLGILEMHWKFVSSTRKGLSPYAYWSQARMIVKSYLLHHPMPSR